MFFLWVERGEIVMNEKKGYDWYKTKTLGDLNKIRKRYGCIWCPKCRGRGTEERLLVEIFKIGLSEIVPCVRCRGRTMVAARKISDDEIS
jgi:hypothetical protein